MTDAERRSVERLLETAEVLHEEGAFEDLRASQADVEAGRVVSLAEARRQFGFDSGRDGECR
jgi:PHD/YefM family antitoxin component YafN of YafNO toxin-antitoxin module